MSYRSARSFAIRFVLCAGFPGAKTGLGAGMVAQMGSKVMACVDAVND